MLLYSEKWHEGYNDGYWLGRDGSFVSQVIYTAYSTYGGDYGKGLQSGFEMAQEQVKRNEKEQDRLDELGKARDKGKDQSQELER